MTLKTVLTVAYGLSAMRITGPGWIDVDRFDLAGKAPTGVPDSDLMPMLQSLLKERLQPAVHRDTREMPVYELTVAKGGLKISVYDPAHPLVPPPRNGAASMIIGIGTISQLADLIAPSAGRPVVNKTELEGRYGYAVTFSPLSAQAADSAQADIFTSVQEQLGLKLEPKREALEILVVDRAERVPTDN